jgi:rubrerythrin
VKEAQMENLQAGDVFEVAIRIEENGERFYRYAVGLTKDPKIRDVFNLAAGEEVKHRKMFQAMAETVGADYEPPESYPGEYCKYVRAYADNQVFSEANLAAQFKSVKTAEDAVEFAIQKEIESILYYLEMKNFVPASQREDVDRIIAEERKHYLLLSDLKRGID